MDDNQQNRIENDISTDANRLDDSNRLLINLNEQAKFNESNELTKSNETYKINQCNFLIRQESKLSQSAPNLNNNQSQLTSEEYTTQFINANLKLFNYYHNLENSTNQLRGRLYEL